MRTSFHAIRGGPLVGLLALFAALPSVHADERSPTHRYAIHGSLEAAATDATSARLPLQLSARLSAPAQDVGVQAGGDFVVIAKLAESPLGCTGSDTIFADGFDP